MNRLFEEPTPPIPLAERFSKTDPTVITDDKAAMEIFVELGILDQLTPPDPNFKKAYFPFQTEHHFGLATYFRNYEKASDNGYCVVLFPKLRYNLSYVTGFFQGLLEEDGAQGADLHFMEIGPKDKTNN